MAKRFLLLLCFLALLYGCDPYKLPEVSYIELTRPSVMSSTFTTVQLKGQVLGVQTSDKISQHGFVWSINNQNPTVDDEIKSLGSRQESGSFSTEITGLAINTAYFIRSFVEIGGDIRYSTEVLTFQPEHLDFSITMDSIKNSTNKIDLYGSITGLDPEVSISSYGHVWYSFSDDPQPRLPEIEVDHINSLGRLNNVGAFIHTTIENPVPGFTYQVRSFLTSGSKAFYSPQNLIYTKGDAWVPLYYSFHDYAQFYFAFDDEVYLYFNNGFYKFDPIENTFKERSPIPDPDYPGFVPSNGSYFVIGNKGYYGNGFWKSNEVEAISNEFWEYDRITDTWRQLRPFPGTLRKQTSHFSVGPYGYVGLGESPDGNLLNDFWEYHPEQDEWVRIADYPGLRRYRPVKFQFADRGCVGPAWFDPLVDCYCYEPAKQGWSRTKDLPVILNPFYDFNYFTIGQKGYFISPDVDNNFWEYDLVKDQWMRRADYPGGAKANAIGFSVIGRGYMLFGDNIAGSNSSSIDAWQYLPEFNE